jgi:hypothetical protein
MPELRPLVEPALADRYQIERELGRGGTAIVYLAQDLRHGRQVAIKVLYLELAASLGPGAVSPGDQGRSRHHRRGRTHASGWADGLAVRR